MKRKTKQEIQIALCILVITLAAAFAHADCKEPKFREIMKASGEIQRIYEWEMEYTNKWQKKNVLLTPEPLDSDSEFQLTLKKP